MNSRLRLQWVDALRGVAALLVVWQHSAEAFAAWFKMSGSATWLAEFASTVDFGRIGVICFFLISGFVIPYSLQAEQKSHLGTFALQRFFRLFPAYWLSILLVVVFNPFHQSGYGLSTIAANLTMLQSFFAESHMQGLFWTLQVELIFYAMCMILYRLGWLHQPVMLLVAVTLLFLVFVLNKLLVVFTGVVLNITQEFQYIPFLLAIMLTGALYRKVFEDRIYTLKACRWAILASGMCFGLPLLLLLLSVLDIEVVPDALRFGLSHCLALLLFLTGAVVLRRVPKAMVWLGTISYSVYLFHPIVMYWLRDAIIALGIELLTALPLAGYILMVMTCSLAVAALVYYGVERPSLRWGKRLTTKR
jgi:peptidoglycan/LPS O-acetylase OafA/YrhL